MADTTHFLSLQVDAHDREAILRAVEIRLALAPLPPGEGNDMGRAVAEICRGWVEMCEAGRAG